MFNIYNLTFHWYGLIVGLSVCLVWWQVTDLSQKFKFFSLKNTWWLVVIATLIGARVWHLVTDWSFYQPLLDQGQWWRLIAVWQGGLSILGAVVGGMLAIRFLAKKTYLVGLDILAVALPVGQAVGRLANWVNQELYGLPTNLPWGIRIDLDHRLPSVMNLDLDIKFQPLFLYESLGIIVLGSCLWWLVMNKKNWTPGTGKLAWLYLTGYCWLRFWLDFLRIDRGPILDGLGFNQWLLLSVGLAGLIYWLVQMTKFLSHFKSSSTMTKKSKLKLTAINLSLVILMLLTLGFGANYFEHQRNSFEVNQILAKKADLGEVSIVFQSKEINNLKNLKTSTLKLTLAKTNKSRNLGLGQKVSLVNDGMLFSFETSAKWQFWMKDMNFPLDFIWLNDGLVVDLTQQVPIPGLNQPDSELAIYTPKESVNQMIELRAGRINELGIKVGDRILILE